MVTLVAALLAAGALMGAAPPPRALVAGPALAGGRVVWGEQQGGLSLLRASPEAAPLWRSTSSWFTGSLAGSSSLVAFSRSYDGCPGRVGFVCPVETETVTGPLRGPLRPLAPAERCSAGGGRRLAVSGSLVAFFQLGCGSSRDTVTVHAGARIVFQRRGATCCDVALAGNYLASRSGGAVDVVDVRAGRVVYRAGAPPGRPIAAFDVQADGKLALVLGRKPDGSAELAWRARGTKVVHRLQFRVLLPQQGPAVRLVGDRVVAEVPGPRSTSQLVVSDLLGRRRVLFRFAAPVEQVGDIDATPERVTWASRRITGTREDCPPPGQGRPCRLLKSGTMTVWVAGLTSGAPRQVASWAFADSP